ncbi:MAG: amino acid adenylation domain-containing protein, partial [Gammaproteobacteria bacterium]|nr:amino acid adenylation domain-containing protein [Gammaproteobacteria bacterium]
MPEFDTEQIFPLTKQQQGLWIEWKLHPENTSYNTCVKVKLKGKLDSKKLGQALNDIVQYFDSLKVYFVEKSGIPYQCIKDKGTYFLNYKDISIEGQNETPEQAQLGLDFLSQTLNTPIDLKVFPIVRASLMKVADKTYYFIGMVPHMISDGRSAVLFLESLSIAYNSGYQGLCDAYDSTIKGWSDFHEDKRNQFDAAKHALSKQHWQERLAEANHYHDYSYGRKNTTKDDKQGHRVYFDIPCELAKALKAHTSKNRTTLFNVMVCAFGIFINRYFSLTDILIGFPISIRPPGYKHLFGFFVNIVPIRVDLSGDPTYQELLERVSKSRKEDKIHQKFPALDIVNAVRENITDFDGQLFNLSMAQTVSRLFNLELDGIETEPLESEYNDVNDDLSLSYELLEDGIGLWLEYRTSIFDEDFIDQGIQHIRQILEQITTAPDTTLSQFKLLSQSQKKEVLSFSQGVLQKQTNTIKPHFTHFIDSFEYQVSNTPETIALHFQDEDVSYTQLNQMANQLARQLISTGVQTTDKIAVCLNRGPQLISSLLAVLKTGCAYIPIAPDYPKQRFQFILEDTQCNYIIYENDTADICRSLSSNTLNLNETIEQRSSLNANNLGTNINGQDTAYIIYTSGSTGKPKGVIISHANLIPRLDCLQKEIHLSETDVMLQNTDFSFDVSVAEIFWPLTTGASLALVAQQESKYPDRLLKLFGTYQITVSCMVPSLLNALLSIASQNDLQSLKYLLVAGEVISSLTVQHFYQLSTAKLYNFYGPTEATIYATFYYSRPDNNINYVPIGKPLLNTETYILDEYKQVQAKGVAGELYLAGKGISSGYLNSQSVNEKVFIDNPFYPEFSDSEKLYRTGDKARYISDGNIDFLGRIDKQVKIRGYRIEVAEIEVNLSTLENIKDSTVNVDITDSYQQTLIAYFVR